MPKPAEIKKALLQAGFEVYRTRGDVVHLAERVRENLLMDSGIYIVAHTLTVGFVVRAQRLDFPGATEDVLFEHARKRASIATGRGYHEINTTVRTVRDPGDPERTLDTWYEVHFEKAMAAVDVALDEVKFVFSFEKVASTT